MSRNRTSSSQAWAFVVVAAIAVTGWSGIQLLQPAQDGAVADNESAASTPAEQLLAQLDETDDSAQMPDYHRDAFGAAWADVDGNGCSTRNDVLARDLTEVSFFADRTCVVASGQLDDPYTGTTLDFTFGEETSQAVQIDHLVPLSLAWRSGAWQWSDDERLAFANDQRYLWAVDGLTNQSKGDAGIADWLPPQASARCSYVELHIEALAEYQLTISAADRAAASEVLDACQAEGVGTND